MNVPQSVTTSEPAAERARLVRLCARLTGDPHVAEDLAQEALLLAWRQAKTLRDPARRPEWLAGIARNRCRHWLRRQRLERARFVQSPSPNGDSITLDQWVADEFDLELELERHELANLLDRALALLPPATREVLVRRYVDESPHAAIAERLGLSEGAVAMRLNRGKLLLKRVLTTELPQEAAAYGLAPTTPDRWQETRIWCPACGTRKLLGRFFAGSDLQLDCPACFTGVRVPAVRSKLAEQVWGINLAETLRGVKGYKPACNRLFTALDRCFRPASAGPVVRCPRCKQRAVLRISPDTFHEHHDIQVVCRHCDQATGISTLIAVMLARLEGQAFWREHGRLRSLPQREIEHAGSPAIAASLTSVTGNARLDVIFARDSLMVLGIYGVPGRT